MKVVVLLEITADGEKHPQKGLRTLFPFSEKSASQKANLIIDDLHEKIFLVLGHALSRIHRVVAIRSASFTRAHGHQLRNFVVGCGFNIIEINEGEEPPPEFVELLGQELRVQEGYSMIVGAPEVVKGPIKPIWDPEEERKVIPAGGLLDGVEDVLVDKLLKKMEAEPAVGQEEGAEPQEEEVEAEPAVEEEEGAEPQEEEVEAIFAVEEEEEEEGTEPQEPVNNNVIPPKRLERPPAKRRRSCWGL